MAKKKDHALGLFAERVEAWAQRFHVSQDPYLSQLVIALREKRDLHIFAELDPMHYLPQLEARANKRILQRIRLVTVIRNTLVFAPVALTWAAVNVSTTAFSKYVTENPNSVSNFLDFWQNGYGYLANHWKIASVAALDFVIILIVIIFTIYISLAGHQISDLRETEQDELDKERTAMALEISKILNDKKKITNVTMNSALAGSVSRLVNASHDLEKAAKALGKASRA